jgi:hypothetical protein
MSQREIVSATGAITMNRVSGLGAQAIASGGQGIALALEML